MHWQELVSIGWGTYTSSPASFFPFPLHVEISSKYSCGDIKSYHQVYNSAKYLLQEHFLNQKGCNWLPNSSNLVLCVLFTRKQRLMRNVSYSYQRNQTMLSRREIRRILIISIIHSFKQFYWAPNWATYEFRHFEYNSLSNWWGFLSSWTYTLSGKDTKINIINKWTI